MIAPCPFCRGASRKLFDATDPVGVAKGRFPIVQCQRCGLVYLGRHFSSEELRSFYPKSYYAYQPPLLSQKVNFRDQIRRYVLARWLNYPVSAPSNPIVHFLGVLKRNKMLVRYPKFVREGALLDVGCGAGAYLLEMRDLGWRVYGVEPSEEAAAHLRSLGIPVHCGTLEEADLPSQSFDVVRFSHVLEHVPSPIDTLNEAAKILRPKGVLMLTVPNWASLTARWFQRHWYHLDAPRHLFWFTPETLQAHLERAGFRLRLLRTEPDYSDFADSLIYASRNRFQRLSTRLARRKTLWKACNKLAFPIRLAMRISNRGSVIHAIAEKTERAR